MGKRGPQPWQPTDAERRLVEHYISLGYTQDQCAALIGKCVDLLARECRDELDNGALKVNAKIGGALFQKAMGGDTAALIWWTKSRMSWSERHHHEITGKDGGPVEYQEQARREVNELFGRKQIITIVDPADTLE